MSYADKAPSITSTVLNALATRNKQHLALLTDREDDLVWKDERQVPTSKQCGREASSQMLQAYA